MLILELLHDLAIFIAIFSFYSKFQYIFDHLLLPECKSLRTLKVLISYIARSMQYTVVRLEIMLQIFRKSQPQRGVGGGDLLHIVKYI